jgi:hypothetical protein
MEDFLKAHFRYLVYILHHKWVVLLEGMKLNVPLWRLIIHDWTKFLPDEWFGYVRGYYAPDGTSRHKPSLESDRARLLHHRRNPHHWEYWVLVRENGKIDPLPMPEVLRREMLADWRGADRALRRGDLVEWYYQNRENIRLNVETRFWLEEHL